MNPLAVRELRVACRSWKLVIILTAYLLVQAAIFSIWIYVASESTGMFLDPTSTGKGLFVTLAVVLVVVVMLVFPAFSSTAIASEHERKSFDLLLLTPLAPWEIALGKFFAAAIQASIFLVATVPLFAMANLFGGIDPAVFFAILWLLVLLSVLISFLGVYASSLVTKSIPAVLVTYMFAFFFGLILLIGFTALQLAARLAAAAFPLIGFLMEPTLKEGAFYVGTLTILCAVYCTFLFLSTTNRLKPTSHNKSTGLRLYWTATAIALPALGATYFLMTRLPSYGYAHGALVTWAAYLALMLLVPALTAPAEAPLPSRRVRREMEKMPQSLKAVGNMFFPGSARGVVHSALITLLATILMACAAWFAFGQLEGRLDDVGQLTADYMEISPDRASPQAALATLRAAGTDHVSMMRSQVETFYSHEMTGFLYLLGALLLTLLVVGQITWKLSLSGLSKTLSGVLAGLLLAVWLAVPYIAQIIGGGSTHIEDQKVSQFSPIHAAILSVQIGKESGRAALVNDARAERHQSAADTMRLRWLTFMGVTTALGAGLLALNLLSHRRVMRLVAQATQAAQARHEPMPAADSAAALQHALQAVTTEAPPPPPSTP
jgi:ABC-type transport system involved in multi-copper enzyme maturation permease subunit